MKITKKEGKVEIFNNKPHTTKGNMVMKYINHKQLRAIKILEISTTNNKGKIEFVEYKGPLLFLNTYINPILDNTNN